MNRKTGLQVRRSVLSGKGRLHEPEVHPWEMGWRLLSLRFSFALQFAAELHAKQARKGAKIPYISHLMSVAALVLENGCDEDTAIAALLHDAIEDQIDQYPGNLKQDIKEIFGKRVLGIVEECSDSQTSVTKLDWKMRKEIYLKRLGTASKDAILVASADKLHNARSILADYKEVGEKLWSRFKGGKHGTLWYYRSIVEILSGKAPKRLAHDLKDVVGEIERLSA